jgi:hypothetical protein
MDAATAKHPVSDASRADPFTSRSRSNGNAVKNHPARNNRRLLAV